MPLTYILGTLATIGSLAIVFLGLPAQIYKNYRNKSTSGLAPLLFYLAFYVYTAWCLYGWFKPDWFLVAAQTPGSLLSLILLIQFLWYGRKKVVIAEEVKEILSLLYPLEEIFVTDILLYFKPGQMMRLSCFVPLHKSYTHQPFSYVTAEQYIRCLSQASYLLMGLLIRDRMVGSNQIDFEDFKKLMINQEIWFRRSNIKYLKNVPKQTEFVIEVKLVEIKTVKQFAICELEIRGGILKGNIEFVAPFNLNQ